MHALPDEPQSESVAQAHLFCPDCKYPLQHSDADDADAPYALHEVNGANVPWAVNAAVPVDIVHNVQSGLL